MNKLLLFFAGLLAILVIRSSLAAEGKYTPPKISAFDILKKLDTEGYKLINEVAYEKKDGVYKVEGMDDKGKKTEAIISAETGELPANLSFSKVEPAKMPVTLMEAAKKVADEGFTDIRKIENEKDSKCFEIKAYNKEGKEYEFKVNKTSGEVKKELW
jgi:uncharacterized membrane protein YkoI